MPDRELPEDLAAKVKFADVDPPSTIRDRLKLVGPGIMFAAAALGSGETIINPHNAAKFGLLVLWVPFFAILLTKMWVTERVGRFSLATGKTFAEGLYDLGWIGKLVIVVMLLPLIVIQFFTGQGWPLGVGASVMGMFYPVGQIPVVGMRLVATAVVACIWYFLVLREYPVFEKVVLGVVLLVLLPAVLIADIALRPDLGTILSLFNPAPLITYFAQNPSDLAYMANSLAWCGSGMVGMAAYSYWAIEKGYHRARIKAPEDTRIMLSDRVFTGWSRVYQLDIYGGNAVTFVVAAAIMLNSVLVLHPYNLVPTGTDVMLISAQQLVIPLGEWAKYLWLIGTASTLFVTPLAYYDGAARLSGDALRLLFPGIARRYSFEQVRKALVTLFCVGAVLMIWGLSPLGPYPLKVVSSYSYIDGLPYMVLLALFSAILVQKFVPREKRGFWLPLAGGLFTALVYAWFTWVFNAYGPGFMSFLTP
ncbi:MAG: Nramp family divalent metal transporter [Chloroflexota bacterium]